MVSAGDAESLLSIMREWTPSSPILRADSLATSLGVNCAAIRSVVVLLRLESSPPTMSFPADRVQSDADGSCFTAWAAGSATIPSPSGRASDGSGSSPSEVGCTRGFAATDRAPRLGEVSARCQSGPEGTFVRTPSVLHRCCTERCSGRCSLNE